MRHFHKNTQAPAVLRQNAVAETQKLINAVAGGNNSPTIDPLYKHAEVKAQLKSDQNGKCAYCERFFNGDYGAVEHFRPKGEWQQQKGMAKYKPGYYWLAYEWENLLYSCSECNTIFKHSLFPLANPAVRDIAHRDIRREEPLLINPSSENPADFIGFRRELVVPRNVNGQPSHKGQTTIDLLGLNSRADLKKRRFDAYREYKILLKIKSILETVRMTMGVTLIDRFIDRHTNECAEFTGMFQNQIP